MEPIMTVSLVTVVPRKGAAFLCLWRKGRPREVKWFLLMRLWINLCFKCGCVNFPETQLWPCYSAFEWLLSPSPVIFTPFSGTQASPPHCHSTLPLHWAFRANLNRDPSTLTRQVWMLWMLFHSPAILPIMFLIWAWPCWIWGHTSMRHDSQKLSLSHRDDGFCRNPTILYSPNVIFMKSPESASHPETKCPPGSIPSLWLWRPLQTSLVQSPE